MQRAIRTPGLAGVVIGIVLSVRGLPAQVTAKVDFARDVQPLFLTYRYGCHGPTAQTNNFRLDRRRDSLPNRVGANGARVVPGNSAASRLYLRVTGQAGSQLPPTGALSKEQIGTIKAWIEQGAEWPDELAGEAPWVPQDPQAAKLMEHASITLQRGQEILAGDWYACFVTIKKGQDCK